MSTTPLDPDCGAYEPSLRERLRAYGAFEYKHGSLDRAALLKEVDDRIEQLERNMAGDTSCELPKGAYAKLHAPWSYREGQDYYYLLDRRGVAPMGKNTHKTWAPDDEIQRSLVAVVNAYPKLVALLKESQERMSKDWINRRDALLRDLGESPENVEAK